MYLEFLTEAVLLAAKLAVGGFVIGAVLFLGLVLPVVLLSRLVAHRAAQREAARILEERKRWLDRATG